MTLRTLSPADYLQNPWAFSAVLDARTPAEFALDHLPSAQNWPVLGDDERVVVGTQYKQDGGFDAKKHGAALVAANVAKLLAERAQDLPADWRPLVYCWRGGKRSGTLAWFLGQIGFETTLLQGGYKAWRAAMVVHLEQLVAPLQFVVICGQTGTGKTRLLHALAAQGAQVLDLEGLAAHRGSVLGALPGTPQPSQKRFDSLLWHALQGFDAARPVFVESESQKVGNVAVAAPLMQAMRQRGRCVQLEMGLEGRVQLLLEDYAHFTQGAGVAQFCERLDALKAAHGGAVVQGWQAAFSAGGEAPDPLRRGQVFGALMTQHYDPQYQSALQRNFALLGSAEKVAVSMQPQAFGAVATTLLIQYDRVKTNGHLENGLDEFFSQGAKIGQ